MSLPEVSLTMEMTSSTCDDELRNLLDGRHNLRVMMIATHASGSNVMMFTTAKRRKSIKCAKPVQMSCLTTQDTQAMKK